MRPAFWCGLLHQQSHGGGFRSGAIRASLAHGRAGHGETFINAGGADLFNGFIGNSIGIVGISLLLCCTIGKPLSRVDESLLC